VLIEEKLAKRKRLNATGVSYLFMDVPESFGTMAAAYWVNKGFSAKEAIAKVRKSRMHDVETKEQEESLIKLEKSLRP